MPGYTQIGAPLPKPVQDEASRAGVRFPEVEVWEISEIFFRGYGILHVHMQEYHKDLFREVIREGELQVLLSCVGCPGGLG